MRVVQGNEDHPDFGRGVASRPQTGSPRKRIDDAGADVDNPTGE